MTESFPAAVAGLILGPCNVFHTVAQYRGNPYASVQTKPRKFSGVVSDRRLVIMISCASVRSLNFGVKEILSRRYSIGQDYNHRFLCGKDLADT